jgi:hypothetical protein
MKKYAFLENVSTNRAVFLSLSIFNWQRASGCGQLACLAVKWWHPAYFNFKPPCYEGESAGRHQ